MEEVNWGYWIKCDAWTLREAILLLEGKEPEGAEPPYSDSFYINERIAIRSNKAKTLLSIDGRPFLKSTIEKSVSSDRRGTALSQSTQNIFAEAAMRNQRILSGIYEDEVVRLQEREAISPEAESIGVDPRTFLKWANSKKLRINNKLQDFFQDNCQEDDMPYPVTNCTEIISPNERRELTLLRKFKEKFPCLINQSVAAALYAGIMVTVREVTKPDLDKGVAMLGVGPLDIELTNQIWKALPMIIKKLNGRPRKVEEPPVCKSIRDAISRKAVSIDLVIDEVPTKEDDGEN